MQQDTWEHLGPRHTLRKYMNANAFSYFHMSLHCKICQQFKIIHIAFFVLPQEELYMSINCLFLCQFIRLKKILLSQFIKVSSFLWRATTITPHAVKLLSKLHCVNFVPLAAIKQVYDNRLVMPPNSHYWLSQCCYLGILKRTDCISILRH